MNPYSDKDRPAGADILPTVQDIAPANLVAPQNSVADRAESLESQLPSLNSSSNRPVSPVSFEPDEIYGNSNHRWVFGLALMLVVLLSAAGFGLTAFVQHSNNKQQSSQGNLSNLNLPSALTANDRNQTLNLNYNTLLNKNLTANGAVVVQNDNSAGFKVQNASGNDLLVVDTARGKVGVGQSPTGNARLQVNGDISINGNLISTTGAYSLSSQGLTINGVLVCTVAGCTNQTVDLSQFVRASGNNTFTGINKFTSGGNQFVGDGSGLSALNAGNISSGTLSDNRLSANVAFLGNNQTFTGSNTFNSQIQAAGGINAAAYSVNGTPGASFSCPVGDLLQQPTIQRGIITAGICVPGNGASVATLQQSYDASVPAHIVLSNVSGLIQIQDAASPLATNLFEVTSNGGAIKYFAVNNLGISVTGNVNTTGQYEINGVPLASTDLSDTASIARLGANQTFTGINTFSNASNSFTGNGSGLISLNASNISSGTLNDTRLSANVTLQGNTFNGASQLVQLTAGGILPILNGSNLTALNASNVSSGTLNDARLSANVPLLNAGQTFTGANTFSNAANSFTGNGSGLTSLNASNITSGTLNDARLSTNVALLSANNIFLDILVEKLWIKTD